ATRMNATRNQAPQPPRLRRGGRDVTGGAGGRCAGAGACGARCRPPCSRGPGAGWTRVYARVGSGRPAFPAAVSSGNTVVAAAAPAATTADDPVTSAAPATDLGARPAST